MFSVLISTSQGVPPQRAPGGKAPSWLVDLLGFASIDYIPGQFANASPQPAEIALTILTATVPQHFARDPRWCSILNGRSAWKRYARDAVGGRLRRGTSLREPAWYGRGLSHVNRHVACAYIRCGDPARGEWECGQRARSFAKMEALDETRPTGLTPTLPAHLPGRVKKGRRHGLGLGNDDQSEVGFTNSADQRPRA